MAELGEKGRDNKLTLDDVQGGTFTLDNTGAFGSIVSMPIINLGQAAIISLEAITKQPRVVDDDAIAVRVGREPLPVVRPPHPRRPPGGRVPARREVAPRGGRAGIRGID